MQLNSINWRRGFFRLWLVGSGCWIAFLIGFVWLMAGQSMPSRSDVVFLTIIALVLPAVVLVVGAALGWALSGFRSR